MGGDEWNTPGYDPTTNLIISGTVDWCDTVKIQTDDRLRSVAVGQPWTGAAFLNPTNMFGRENKTDGYWAGWVYATDADTGVWKWRVKSNYPILGAITSTAGGVVFSAIWVAISMHSIPLTARSFGDKFSEPVAGSAAG